MTVVPLTSMPAAAALTGSEIFYLQQSAADAKATISQITAMAGATAIAVTTSDPTGSATGGAGVMMGLGTTAFGGTGAVITPVRTGVVLFHIIGNVVNSGVNSTFFNLRYGSGSAPVNGAAATGTALTRSIFWNQSATAPPMTLVGAVAGLSLGTAFWWDVAISVSAGTGSISNVYSVAVEL